MNNNMCALKTDKHLTFQQTCCNQLVYNIITRNKQNIFLHEIQN